jgi:hypothetical protein
MSCKIRIREIQTTKRHLQAVSLFKNGLKFVLICHLIEDENVPRRLKGQVV